MKRSVRLVRALFVLDAAVVLIAVAVAAWFAVDLLLRMRSGASLELFGAAWAAALLAVLGGVRLRRRRMAAGTSEATRSYSFVPYAMLGVVLTILLLILPPNLPTVARVTVGGLFTIVLLVMVRQIVAFGAADTLVRRLDATLLTVRRQEERMRLMVEHSSDVTSLIDAEGRMTYLTPATERCLGYDPDGMLGMRVVSLIHPDDLPAILPDLQRLMTTPHSTYTYEARYRHADGSWRWLQVISRNLMGEPSIGAVVSNARDVTETRQLQDRLLHQAHHDPLTGLANRALFGTRLAEIFGAAGTAVLLADLDGFKPINDTYGHHAGDVVLAHFAALLRRAAPGALVARLGGDEFAVLLADGGLPAARAVADRLAGLLDEPVGVDGHRLRVRASVGATAGPADSAEELMRRADEEMYRVKHATAGHR